MPAAAGDGISETSRYTVLLVPVDSGSRLDLAVEGVSGAEAAEGLRTGRQRCLKALRRNSRRPNRPAPPAS